METNTRRLWSLLPLFFIILLTIGLVTGFKAGAQDTGEQAIYEQVRKLENAIAATSAAYPQRAEEARKQRAHCTIADHLEHELTSMQQENAARRKQVAILKSMLPQDLNQGTK